MLGQVGDKSWKMEDTGEVENGSGCIVTDVSRR